MGLDSKHAREHVSVFLPFQITFITRCDLSPCANGGTCNVVNGTGFSCTCPPGWAGEKCELYICGDNCYMWYDTVVVQEQTYYSTNIPTLVHGGIVGISLANESLPTITAATLHWTTPLGNGATNIWDINSITPTQINVPADATDFRVDIYFSGLPLDMFGLKVLKGAGPGIVYLARVLGRPTVDRVATCQCGHPFSLLTAILVVPRIN
jgi:hypothetical protein